MCVSKLLGHLSCVAKLFDSTIFIMVMIRMDRRHSYGLSNMDAINLFSLL